MLKMESLPESKTKETQVKKSILKPIKPLLETKDKVGVFKKQSDKIIDKLFNINNKNKDIILSTKEIKRVRFKGKDEFLDVNSKENINSQPSSYHLDEILKEYSIVANW